MVKNIVNGSTISSIDSRLKNIQLTNDLIQLTVLDTRFTIVNQSGHSTILPSTLGDVNDSGNTNFLMESTATTLDIVSTDDEDGAGTFTGINVLVIQGLDQNLNEITDVVVLNGLTPVTSNLSFRTMNLALAAAGGTPGSGCIGDITISGTVGGQVFGKLIVDDTTCEVGRFTVPTGKRWMISSGLFNGGVGADMVFKAEVTAPGAFPISIGEFYIGGGQVDNTASISNIFLEAGTLFKYRGFTVSGSPSTRKINLSIVGVLATIEAWDSLLIN